jgi:hypothetical protein
MNYLEKFNPGRLLVVAFLFSANFVFAQKAYIKPEVYVPVPMEEQPFFNNDELALKKAQQVSDFQMRIYAHAATMDQMAKLESIRTELDTKCKKLCPNYPGTNLMDADRNLVERWVLEYPIEVVYFDEVLNTVLYRLNEVK